jgi:membrane peptidoglycan carboxypeptidase
VRLIQSVGGGNFLSRLARVRLAGDDRESRDRYGLGIAIGNVEVTLLALAEAYGVFPRGGLHRPLAWTPGPPRADARVFDPRVAYLVTDILADPTARLLTFGTPSFYDVGYPVALKTGTSTRSRDAWLVAWNPRHVIALWAGNFDGAPSAGAGGATALGPLLRDLLRRLYPASGPGHFARPPGIVEREVCGLSGMAPSPHCPSVTRTLPRGTGPDSTCTFRRAGSRRPRRDLPRMEPRASLVASGNFAVAGVDAGRTAGGDDGMPPRIVAPRGGPLSSRPVRSATRSLQRSRARHRSSSGSSRVRSAHRAALPDALETASRRALRRRGHARPRPQRDRDHGRVTIRPSSPARISLRGPSGPCISPSIR